MRLTAANRASLAPVASKNADPLLVGVLQSDISKAKRLAERSFHRSWKVIAIRSRFVRKRLLDQFNKLNVPTSLQVIPIAESAYNPYAFSRVGAIGMWQLMPRTASKLGIHASKKINGSRDIDISTDIAVHYLMTLHQRFHCWPLAFAAYNLGPYAVKKRLKNRPWLLSDGLDNMPVPTETRIYVQHIIGLTALLHDGRFTLPEPVDTQKIHLKAPVDLHKLAQISGLSRHELFRLNPGLNQSQYLNSDITIHVPSSRFENIQRHASDAIPEFVLRRVASGESLWSIARAHQTHISTLRSLNKHIGKYLHVGQILKVPANHLDRATAHGNPLLVNNNRRIHYKVRSGDSLWGIADRFGTTPGSIARANNIHMNHLIRAGDRLWVYASLKVSPS